MQKVIRLSVIGLSAAATVIFMLTTFLNAPRNISITNTNTASIAISEKIYQKPAAKEINVRKVSSIQQKTTLAKADLTAETTSDSLVKRINNQVITITRVNLTTDISPLKNNSVSNNLIAYNSTYIVPEEDDGRSNISRFISKTFREKLLKEKSPQNNPLKGYEIAEAGVEGLNKLLGWEMALDKNNDDNGELSSVYFSSKLIKFNTAVKKSEPSE